MGAPAGLWNGASHSDVGAPAGVSGGASHSDVGAPAGVCGSWSSVMEVPTSSMYSNSTLLSLYSSLPVLFPSALYNLMLSAGMTVF